MALTFISSRLLMARSLRGLSATALARQAEVTPEWLSKVERNRTTPSDDLVDRLAKELDMPVGFFFREPPKLPTSETFNFRASSKLALKDETAARSLAALATELSQWMDETYHLPSPGIPEVQEVVGAELEVTSELAAEALRAHWGLGASAISSMVELLEAKGARVFSVSGDYQAIDAFSFREFGTCLIFLNPSKSAERLRFDLAHELGHLVLHGGSLFEPDSKVRERQANDFASAFLMPRVGVLGGLRGNVAIGDILEHKHKWKVSAMALTVRLHQLGVLSDWTYRMNCQELAKRGFRRNEPGSSLLPETSSLWTQILADLRTQGSGLPHLADLLGVRTGDVRAMLVGLVPTAIAGGGQRTTGRSPALHVVES